jgi:Fe-S oxidoreductase
MGIFSNFGKRTLYYPGCMLKGVLTEEQENYKKIFNKLGIDFVMLASEEVCCGSPVYNAGYRKDARKLAQKNFDLLKQKKISKILTPCPGCYNMFHNEYPKLLRDWDIEVEFALKIILEKLKKKKISDFVGEVVTYHDPCHLGRYSGIYDEPREIIRILGGKLKEMTHNRENSLCCGAGGGMRANFSNTAKEIAKKRTAEAPKDAEKILTPCGLCHANLSTADGRSEELSSWILRRLG